MDWSVLNGSAPRSATARQVRVIESDIVESRLSGRGRKGALTVKAPLSHLHVRIPSRQSPTGAVWGQQMEVYVCERFGQGMAAIPVTRPECSNQNSSMKWPVGAALG